MHLLVKLERMKMTFISGGWKKEQPPSSSKKDTKKKKTEKLDKRIFKNLFNIKYTVLSLNSHRAISSKTIKCTNFQKGQIRKKERKHIHATVGSKEVV